MKTKYDEGQFPQHKPKQPAKKYRLTYRGETICSGDGSLVFGRKANLLKSGNFTAKYFKVVVV